jgi:hypothetical protein
MKAVPAIGWALSILILCPHQTPAAPAATNSPAGFRLIVELQDGSKIIGRAGDDNFQFHSEVLGEMKLPLERIRSVECQPKTNSVQLTTANGDTLTAQFVAKVVRVETSFGGVKLPVNSIQRLTVSPAGKPGQMREGLVALWSGEGNALDSIGANNGALVNGAGFAAGKVGQAFSFNGASYVSIPDSPSLDTFISSITIEAWIKVNQFNRFPDWNGIVTKGNSSWRLARYGNSSVIGFSTTGLSNGDLAGNKNINDGQWHHVAAVYDGTNKYIYVDGVLDASAPATGMLAQNSYPVCLGENVEAPGHLWNGLIDEVSIYNCALSASEIQADYAAGGGN